MRLILTVLAMGIVMSSVNMHLPDADAQGGTPQAMQADVRSIANQHLKYQRYPQAILMLTPYVEEHPEDLAATFSLAQALYRNEEFDTAKRYIAQLTDLAPNDAHTLEAQNWLVHDPAFTRTSEQRQKDNQLAVLALSVSRGDVPNHLVSSAPITQNALITSSPLLKERESSQALSQLPVLQEQTVMDTPKNPAVSPDAPRELVTDEQEASSPSPLKKIVDAVTTKKDAKPDDLEEMKALMKQMMMMQMMQGASANNPFSAMGNGGGNPLMGGMGGMNPMMMQMMQQGGGMGNAGTSSSNAMNAQAMQQMMQQSMMQNMTNMFNAPANNTDDSNQGGFGF